MNSSKQKMIILIMLPFVLLAGGMSIYHGYTQAQNFSADGIVVEVNWKSYNHGLPLFIVKNGVGKPKNFQSSQITLNSDQIKIGYTFVKKAGSKICKINGVEIQCIK